MMMMIYDYNGDDVDDDNDGDDGSDDYDGDDYNNYVDD